MSCFEKMHIYNNSQEIQLKRTETLKGKQVIILGAGGHGRVISDIIACSGDYLLGYLDDRDPHEFIEPEKILGKIRDVKKYKDNVLFIVGIGDNEIRKQLMRVNPVNWYTAIHPSSVIATGVKIGEGTVIMPNTVINVGSKIGQGVIINTSATIDHDNIISDFVHISPGVHLGGAVSIGEGTWVGIGSTVINNVKICKNCIVGAGSLVLKDIAIQGTYVGNPVRLLI